MGQCKVESANYDDMIIIFNINDRVPMIAYLTLRYLTYCLPKWQANVSLCL